MLPKPTPVMALAFAVTIAISIVLSVPFLLSSSVHNTTHRALATAPSTAVSIENAVQRSPAAHRELDKVARKGFRGFCQCSCTSVPDCNTSEDCGGAACLHSITCCEKPNKSGSLLAQSSACSSKKSWKID